MHDKHFINDSSSLIVESLRGLVARAPALQLDVRNKIVFTKADGNVALISGGGSGHEPAHAGFVGQGMLSAAVCGNVFASPNAGQIRRAIELVQNDKGTILIVKNYTGDVLNFGLARERYLAEHPEISNVRMVVVGDDVAVGKTQSAIVGRRGLAGTVMVYKIAGALAAEGATLDRVSDVAQYVAGRVGTIGISAEHVHVPGTALGESALSSEEVEIGMGIHNESGVKRLSPVPPLDELISHILDPLTSTTDPERSYLPLRGDGTDRVVLMVNNLGGISELELNAVTHAVTSQFENRRVTLVRILVGTFMTSLNMHGFSLTLLPLPADSDKAPLSEKDVLRLLDMPANVPGWPSTTGATSLHTASADVAAPQIISESSDYRGSVTAEDSVGFVQAIRRACEALIAAEAEITRMDTIAGDGDCGLTLKSGAEGVLAAVANDRISGDNVVQSVLAISSAAEEQMGGTSGALYSIFFSALAQALSGNARGTKDSRTVWAQAAQSALDTLYTYTRARPPSRTLVDPLAAFVAQLQAPDTTLKQAVRSAAEAAERTKELEAKAGRSAYVEGDRLRDQAVPDPGAWGIKVILEALIV